MAKFSSSEVIAKWPMFACFCIQLLAMSTKGEDHQHENAIGPENYLVDLGVSNIEQWCNAEQVVLKVDDFATVFANYTTTPLSCTLIFSDPNTKQMFLTWDVLWKESAKHATLVMESRVALREEGEEGEMLEVSTTPVKTKQYLTITIRNPDSEKLHFSFTLRPVKNNASSVAVVDWLLPVIILATAFILFAVGVIVFICHSRRAQYAMGHR